MTDTNWRALELRAYMSTAAANGYRETVDLCREALDGDETAAAKVRALQGGAELIAWRPCADLDCDGRPIEGPMGAWQKGGEVYIGKHPRSARWECSRAHWDQFFVTIRAPWGWQRPESSEVAR